MNDLAELVPGTIACIFPRQDDGHLSTIPNEIAVTLTSLALPEYVNITGAPWAQVLHRYELAIYAGGAWQNQVALTSLAKQVATDWYRWQLAMLDLQYTGAVPWNPDGLHDVEWRHDGLIATRVRRGPFNPQEDLHYQALAVVGGESVVNNLTVINEFFINNFEITVINNITYVNFYENVIINIWDGVNWNNPTIATLVSNVCHFTYKTWVPATGQIALSSSTNKTVATLNFTLQQTTSVNFFCYYDFKGDGSGTPDFRGGLTVDGVDYGAVAGVAALDASALGALSKTFRLTVAYQYVVSLTAGSHTALLQAWIDNGQTGFCDVNSKLVVEAVPVVVVEQETFYLPNGTLFTDPVCAIDPQTCCPAQGPSSAVTCSLCKTGTEPRDYMLVLSGFAGCSSGTGCNVCDAGTTPGLWFWSERAFTGDFAAFNGDHELLAGTPCNYTDLTGGSLAITSNGDGTLTVTLVVGNLAGTFIQYQGTIPSTNCCLQVLLTEVSRNGTGAFPNQITVVPANCGDGTGGVCDPNGIYFLSESSPCTWTAHNGDIGLVMTMSSQAGPNVLVKLLVYCNDVVIATYNVSISGSTIDCCQDIALSFVSSTTCTTVPATLFAIPQGCSSGSGSGSSGGGGGCAGQCNLCATGTAPTAYEGTLSGAAGCSTDPNGGWKLTNTGNCIWAGKNANGAKAVLRLLRRMGGSLGVFEFGIQDANGNFMIDGRYLGIGALGFPLPFDCKQSILLTLSKPAGSSCADVPPTLLLTPVQECGGGSSGGSGGGSGISTSCCPSNLIPATLKVTVTHVSGPCNCVAGVYNIVWNGSSAWEGDFQACNYASGSTPGSFHIILTCMGGVFLMNIYYTSFSNQLIYSFGSVATCSPFHVAFANGSFSLGGNPPDLPCTAVVISVAVDAP